MSINAIQSQVVPFVTRPSPLAALTETSLYTDIFMRSMNFLPTEDALSYSSITKGSILRTEAYWKMTANILALPVKSGYLVQQVRKVYQQAIVEFSRIVQIIIRDSPPVFDDYKFHRNFLDDPLTQKKLTYLSKETKLILPLNSIFLPQEFVHFQGNTDIEIHAPFLRILQYGCFGAGFLSLKSFCLVTPGLVTLPDNFFALFPNLESLDLSCPRALSTFSPRIRKTNLKIKTLTLKFNCQFYPLPSFVTFCNGIQILTIEGTARKDLNPFELPDILLVADIRSLTLINTQIETLPNWISIMQMLECLDLKEERNVSDLPDDLLLLPELKNLYINFDALGKHGRQVVEDLRKKGVLINVEEELSDVFSPSVQLLNLVSP